MQCFAYEDGVLYLQSLQPLAVKKSHQLLAEVPMHQRQGQPLTVKVKVRIEAAHELTQLWDKRLQGSYGQVLAHLYSGVIEGPAEVIPHLESLLEPLPQPRELRTQPRAEQRLRATSPELPGYIGIVMDLSMGGLGMLVEKPMERGRRLQFEIEFDEQRSNRLELTGHICWCRPEPGAAFRIGVRFEPLSDKDSWTLRQVVEKLLAAEVGELSDNKFLRG